MRKVVSCVLISATIISLIGIPSVLADKSELTGYEVDNGVYVEYPSSMADVAVLTVFDDNELIYSTHASKETGGYFFSMPDDQSYDRLRIYCVGDGLYDVQIKAYDGISSATESEEQEETEPEITEEPVSEAESVRTPRPEVYEKNLDAINAPALVRSVSEQRIDGETYYVTTMLYQGVEITSNIRDWVTVDSAPEWRVDLIGQNAGALKEGDVIHFVSDLQHQIKSIDLIYRPDFDEYITSGGDYGTKYNKIVGKDRYSTFVFGVPVKTAKGYILLADINGKTTEVDVSQKAFIYSVSKGRRANKCELSGTGASAISRVYVPNNAFDDNENVISWDDVDVTYYALARIVNGTATEVIVFGY